MLAVGRDDLVVRGQAEPRQDDVAAVRGRGRERHVLGRHADEGRELLPHGRPQLERTLEVRRPAAAVLEIGLLLGGHRLDRRAGERPVRARVQVGEPLEDGELRASLLEGHSNLVSTGA